MTERFRYSVQTKCGFKRTEFTVDLAETLKHETDTEASGKKGIGTEAFIITAVSGFVIIIIVIAIICVRRITTMNAVNAVQLFVLVWTFTAVCQADEDISVSCNDVTGSVGKEVTLTCSVSLLIDNCCIKNNMFKYNDLIICKQEVPEDSCEHRESFTCRYTPTTAMTDKYSFFVQASCGWNITRFTVDTTGYLRHINTAAGLGSKEVVSSLIIIIIMTVIHKTKPNCTKLSGFQNKMFLVIRHEDSSYPEDVI
ncbi:hypothetical protein G5714_012291 [Onychostoma macrolepis]|uniref:Uncharacterized protein n=1 Tax=Onychostoma macrolepis TaxID=369639 RepID=A0A7J6CGN6_9TELE|nr:hypothetical protein G5714_012291 [Onychostoma macrolepis]